MSQGQKVASHPITLMVVGFVLTGVVGTIFSTYLSDAYNKAAEERAEKQAAVDEARRKKDERQRIVRQISKVIYARRTRAIMLASAIRRDKRASVLRRKIDYDEAYFAWNRDIQSNLLEIRSLSRSETYSEFEAIFEQGVTNVFRRIDRCLTNAYDSYTDLGRGADDAQAVLESCDIRGLFQHSLDCVYGYTDALYTFTSTAIEVEDSESEDARAAPITVDACPKT